MISDRKFDVIVEKYLEELRKRDILGMLGAAALSTATPTDAQIAHAPTVTHSITAQPTDLYKVAFDYIKRHEGLRLQPYKDIGGHLTIGIGHKILPGEDFSKGITIEQAYSLFKKDLNSKMVTARGLFPKFDSYPVDVKTALLDGIYRGDHRKEFRTTKLINTNRWAEAAKEYLRNADYVKSKQQDTGVWKRMYQNSQILTNYDKQIPRTESIQKDRIRKLKKGMDHKWKPPRSIARFQTIGITPDGVRREYPLFSGRGDSNSWTGG
jgi:GH24 family phage-related lysozyme (muramidase)